VQPRDGHPLAHASLGHAVTDQLDPADTLVPGNERRDRLDRPVAMRGMDVGVAQARGLQVDDHLPGSGRRDGPLLDDEGLTQLAHNCSLHRDAPSVGYALSVRDLVPLTQGRRSRPG
jgi:hypothetical protein